MDREAAHVHLVDDRVFHRRERRGVLLPVVGAADEEAAAMGAACGAVASK